MKLLQRLTLFCVPASAQDGGQDRERVSLLLRAPAICSPNSPMGPKSQQGRNGKNDTGWDSS